MLQKSRSTKENQWKYALLLPILVAFILSFNTKIVAQEKKLIEVEEIDKLKVELIIDKNSTNETLKKEAAFFKKEFDIEITFKGIKRNSDNQITTIKINASGNDLKSKFENSGNKPINPIKISYDSSTKSIAIGNVVELNDNHFVYKSKKGSEIYIGNKQTKKNNFIFKSSDGKTTTWTSDNNYKIEPDSGKKEHIIFLSKDGNDTIKTEKIILKSTGNNVWIQEKEDDKNIEIEILNEEDNAKENIFIIKSDSDNNLIHKKSNKETIILNADENQKPLIIINGKETTHEEMEKIEQDKIESINVLKGESANKKYGDKGKNGVIEIKLKKN